MLERQLREIELEIGCVGKVVSRSVDSYWTQEGFPGLIKEEFLKPFENLFITMHGLESGEYGLT